MQSSPTDPASIPGLAWLVLRRAGAPVIGALFVIVGTIDTAVTHVATTEQSNWWTRWSHWTPERPLYWIIAGLSVLCVAILVGAVRVIRNYGKEFGIAEKNKAFALRWRLQDLLTEGVRLRAEWILVNGDLARPGQKETLQQTVHWVDQVANNLPREFPQMAKYGGSMEAFAYVQFKDALDPHIRDRVQQLDNNCSKLATLIASLEQKRAA